MSDVISASLSYNVDAAGGEPVQVLLPYALVLDQTAMETVQGAAIYPLGEDYFQLPTADDRAEVFFSLGRALAEQGEIRPVAVFFAYAAYGAAAEDLAQGQAPSDSPSRTQVVVASGLWADGTQALLVYDVDAQADGSFLLSLPDDSRPDYSDAADSPDGGGILAAFYQGYFSVRR